MSPSGEALEPQQVTKGKCVPALPGFGHRPRRQAGRGTAPAERPDSRGEGRGTFPPVRPPVPSHPLLLPRTATAGSPLPTSALQPAAPNVAAGRDAGLPPAVPPSEGCLSPLRGTGKFRVAFPRTRHSGKHPRVAGLLKVRRAGDARCPRAFGEAVPAAGATPATRDEIPGGCPSASSREGHGGHTHTVPPRCKMCLPGSGASG